MDCWYILASNLVLMSARKKTNENTLSLFTFEVEVDSDFTGSREEAVLSLRLGQ